MKEPADQHASWTQVDEPEVVETREEYVQLSWRRVQLEDEILDVLDARPVSGEQVEMAFRRKEQQLVSVLSRLSAIESLALQRRLNLSLPGDPIAQRFARLVVERRMRLLSFLSGARRREALRTARAGVLHG